MSSGVEGSIGLSELTKAVDSGFVLTMGTLVIFMQCGFACLEVGAGRIQNAASILLKNLIDILLSTLAFYLIGYGIAFGVREDLNNTFMGFGSYNTVSADQSLAFFNMAFASTACTIVSGSLLERTSKTAYLIWSAALVIFIYPFPAHWVWSSTGWLSISNKDPAMGRGLLDFAGGGVVHLVGGVAALVGAIKVGPRHGFLDDDGKVQSLPGHSIQLTGIGAMILWFGFYGFNCGSTLGLSGGRHFTASLIAVNTTLAAASAGLVAVITFTLIYTDFHVGDVINCTITGLVSITSACNAVHQLVACVIGIISALVFLGSQFLVRRLKIDDPLSAISVHGAGGIWALLSAGLFANGSHNARGAFYGDGTQLGVQIAGLIIIAGWAAVLSIIFFTIIDMSVGLRVSLEKEKKGLDGEIGANQNLEMVAIKETLYEENGLNILLKTPNHPTLLRFRKYLKAEFAAENIDFLIDVSAFRLYAQARLYQGNQDVSALQEIDQEIRGKAGKIYRRYVKSDSPHAVTLSSYSREEIRQELENKSDTNSLIMSFSRAYTDTVTLLKGDPWKRFLRDVENNERTTAFMGPSQAQTTAHSSLPLALKQSTVDQ